MQFARRFWIAVACTLGLLFGSSVVQAQQTRLLPNDTEMVVTFNVQQILKSEVVKSNKEIFDVLKGKFTEELNKKEVGKWLKKAEFDLLKDLTSVTIAIPGGARDPQEGFILLEGTFDAEKIEAAAIEATKDSGEGFKIIKIAGVRAFEITPKDEKRLFVAVLNTKTLIACVSKSDFMEAAGRATGKKPAQFKSAPFKNLIETVNSKQSFSLVTTSSLMLKFADRAPEGAPQSKEALDFVKETDGFSAAVTIQKNVDFQFGVNTKDAETAKKYAGMANLVFGMMKSKVEDKAKTDDKAKTAVNIINSVRITARAPISSFADRSISKRYRHCLSGFPWANNNATLRLAFARRRATLNEEPLAVKPSLPPTVLFHTQNEGDILPEPFKENVVMQFARRLWIAAACASACS